MAKNGKLHCWELVPHNLFNSDHLFPIFCLHTNQGQFLRQSAPKEDKRETQNSWRRAEPIAGQLTAEPGAHCEPRLVMRQKLGKSSTVREKVTIRRGPGFLCATSLDDLTPRSSEARLKCPRWWRWGAGALPSEDTRRPNPLVAELRKGEQGWPCWPQTPPLCPHLNGYVECRCCCVCCLQSKDIHGSCVVLWAFVIPSQSECRHTLPVTDGR